MAVNVMGANRRVFMGGLLGSAVLMLPACAATADFVVTGVVRRLMKKSSEKAIENMMAPDGEWDREIRSAGLREGAGLRGQVLAAALTSDVFKDKAEHAFIGIAKDATDVAAPIIADAIREIGIKNAIEIAKGGPEAATQALRTKMDTAISNSVLGTVRDAIQSPEATQLREVLQGVDREQLAVAAGQVATRVEEVFWREMGEAEAEIRSNPQRTGDAELIKLLTE